GDNDVRVGRLRHRLAVEQVEVAVMDESGARALHVPATVGDADVEDGLRLGRDAIPRADRLQHLRRAVGDGGGATVIGRADQRIGGLRLDHDGADAALGAGDGERQADQPAADHDQLGLAVARDAPTRHGAKVAAWRSIVQRLQGRMSKAKFTADFGKTAADYARYRAGYPDWLFERLMRRGLVRPGMHALDLATGTGYVARGLAQRGLTVTGLDIAPDMMDAAKALDAAQGLAIDYVVAKAEETGLPSGSFDLVTAACCWHWFDRIKATAEVLRLLKPGGWLVICAQ